MSFDRAWVLAIAWLPLAWAVWEWNRTRRRSALAVKAITLTAILIALAEPRLSVDETKVAVAVLVDTSASVSNSDLDKASQLAHSMESAQGRNWIRVVPFARSTRDLDSAEASRSGKIRETSGEAGRATDLEAAVREAIASLPSGLVPRVALISDGKENKGSIARAAWQAQQLGIPIDTFGLEGKPRPALHLDSISLPSMAFTGEPFPIDLVVSAPSAGPVDLELSAEGKPLAKTQAVLQAGSNPVRMHTSLNTPGALDLSLNIHSPSGGEIRFEQAVTLRRPKVLYLTGDPPAQDQHLMELLAAAQFDVERETELPKSKLSDHQLVIFNDWDLESLPDAFKDDVERYVKQGGGLLVIAGEKSMYREGKTKMDALDRTLPATLAPPRSPEGTAVILIIDKSSSMEGRKIELARMAASGVVENLRPIDTVGVLMFDNSFEWAVTPRKAEDRVAIKRLIAGIRPDGGTQIAPALAEAYARVKPGQATYKHIVLLTDGISEEGDSLDLSKRALTDKITISTVGLGQDVNRSYLEKIATGAGGKSYFLNDPAGLEQILLHDVLEHTGSTAVEKLMPAELVKQAEILDGVGIDTAPALKGYVRFIPKPSADMILRIDRKEPLLERWQYGLGRSAVFASDAKARWAAEWVNWKGYDKFWTNLSRDLLPHSQGGEAVAEFDSANGDLVVNYRLGPEVEEPASIPEIFVLGPDDFRKTLPVKKVAAGTYQGRLAIGQRQGLFRVRPLEDSRAFPEAGLYRPEAELNDFGSNDALLKQVAAFTGGRYQPDPRNVFDPGRRSIASTLQLWPGFLGLAVALGLAELVMRKWKGVMGGA
ncbi:MAG TPA: VWA domain-containing protein [Bryobacteraceae bacterium]|jgi:Mg-chelatase subunit ChlD